MVDAESTRISASVQAAVIRNCLLNLGASSLPALLDIIIARADRHIFEKEPSSHDAAVAEATIIQTFRDPIMCKISDNEFSKLRITRAYIKLLCIPEGDAKIVSLARIGNYEVRMFEASQSSSDAAPLFSIELFDHDAQSPVDSRACYDIGEGVAAYQDFISQ